jgi:hypothetical protein
MKQPNMLRPHFASLSLVCLFTAILFAQAPSTPPTTTPGQEPQLSTRDSASAQTTTAAASFDQVIDRAVVREHFFIAQMKQLHPLVKPTSRISRRIRISTPPFRLATCTSLAVWMVTARRRRAFTSPTTGGLGRRMLNKLSNVYTMKFLPLGFAQMVVLRRDFSAQFYDFTFVRREFLGEVRCIVMDVAPKKTEGAVPRPHLG